MTTRAMQTAAVETKSRADLVDGPTAVSYAAAANSKNGMRRRLSIRTKAATAQSAIAQQTENTFAVGEPRSRHQSADQINSWAKISERLVRATHTVQATIPRNNVAKTP